MSAARDAIRVWEAGQRGELDGIEAFLAALARDGSDEAKAWHTALLALWWHAEPGRGALPSPAWIEPFVRGSTEVRTAAALACSQVERAALLALDRDALSRWAALHGTLLRGGEAPEALLSHEAARCWEYALAGDLAGLDAIADRFASDASKARAAWHVIEATSVRALGSMIAGDLEGALATARRASRMSRTEALPQQEYLANVVLARLRRATNRPHLAVRILAALARVAPRQWAGWLAWELRIAGDTATAESLAGAPPDHGASGIVEHAAPAADALGAMLGAAALGDRAGFDQSLSAARALLAGCPWRIDEIDAASAALDPDVEPSYVAPEIAAWITGATADPPPALTGLCTVADVAEASESAVAYVMVQPPRDARRVLALGLGLAGDDARRVKQMKRKKGRTDTALAVLALAGRAGLSREELFKAVYGFVYSPILHQGVLDVLLHRIRPRLQQSGALGRDGERFVLELGEGLLVPDPRCTQAIEGQVLRLLATRAAGTAKEAAEALGVPLRTAQAALQQLVGDGALISERKGNQVAYRVEDTTFSEPTKHRM